MYNVVVSTSKTEKFVELVAGTFPRVIATTVATTVGLVGVGFVVAEVARGPAPIETTISSLAKGKCSDNTRYSVVGRAALIDSTTSYGYDWVYGFDPVAGRFGLHYEHKTTATNNYLISEKSGVAISVASTESARDPWLPPKVFAPNYDGKNVRVIGSTGTDVKALGCHFVNYVLEPVA